MRNELEHIDELFKKELENHSIESTSADIVKFSETLNRFNFLRFSLLNFNIYYLLLIVIGFTTGAVILSNEKNEPTHKESIFSDSDSEENLNINNEKNNSIDVQSEKQSSDQVKILTIPDNKIIKTNNNEVIINTENNKNTQVNQTGIIVKTDTVQKTINILDTVYVTKKVIITDTIKKIVPEKNKIKKNK